MDATGVKLGIDIGGTGIKGAPVDLETGDLTGERFRLLTPKPATPDAVADIVAQVVKHFGYQGAVGGTFPGVVKHGVVQTAANVDKSWVGTDARARFEDATGCTFTVTNDADCAGVAEMKFGAGAGRQGVVIIVTLGTGIGTAVFHDGVLLPNTELGHLEVRGKDAETWAADSVARAQGPRLEEMGEAGRRVPRSPRGADVARPDHHRWWREQEGREVHPPPHASLRGGGSEAAERSRHRRRGAHCGQPRR